MRKVSGCEQVCKRDRQRERERERERERGVGNRHSRLHLQNIDYALLHVTFIILYNAG